MSHSANIGLERQLAAGLSLLDVYAPAASRFRAMATAFQALPLGKTRIDTTIGLVALTGRARPRLNLMVTRVGIDGQGLSALNDGIGDDALPSRGALSARPSCSPARPSRLAPFSSCRLHS